MKTNDRVTYNGTLPNLRGEAGTIRGKYRNQGFRWYRVEWDNGDTTRSPEQALRLADSSAERVPAADPASAQRNHHQEPDATAEPLSLFDRASTDDGYEERILDAENAAAEPTDWDDEAACPGHPCEDAADQHPNAGIGDTICGYNTTEED